MEESLFLVCPGVILSLSIYSPLFYWVLSRHNGDWMNGDGRVGEFGCPSFGAKALGPNSGYDIYIAKQTLGR